MDRIRTFKANIMKNGNGAPETDELFQTIQDIRKQINLLKRDVEKVQKLHMEILATPIVFDNQTQELDNLNSAIKHCSISVRNKLKEMKKSIAVKEGEDSSQIIKEYGRVKDTESIHLLCQTELSTHLRIQKVQYAAYLKMYTDIINQYNEIQIQHRDNCRARLKTQIQLTNALCTEEQIENMIDEGNFTVYTQGIVAETQEAKKKLSDIRARHTDLIKLEKSIEILRDIFDDIEERIQAQGDKIDSVELHTNAAHQQVMNGKENLQIAAEHKRVYEKKKIILAIFLSILIFLGIIAVVVVLFV